MTRRPPALVLALTLTLAPMLSACSESPATHATAARRAYDAMDYPTARIEALAALDTGKLDDVATRDLLTLLARTQLRLADGDGAQTTVARLEASGQHGAAINRLKAEAALLRNLPQQTLAMLGNDPDPDAWRLRAAAYQALGQGPSAVDAFRRGMAAGDDVQLARDYATFLMTAEDIPAAERVLARLRRIDAGGLDTAMVEGMLYQKQGRLDAAATTYDRAIAAHPKRIEPLLERASVADMQDQLDRAIAFAGRAAQLAPSDPRVLALQVQFASEKGDWDAVRRLLAPREADLDPRTPEGLAYAEALLRLGHPEQARVIFARALLLSPQNPYARMMLAEAQLAGDDAVNALKTVQPLADSLLAGPRELELAQRAARAAGDPRANALAQRMRSARFDDNQRLARTGEAAMVRRDWPGAIEAYRALLAQGDDGEVFKRLALACSNAGRHREAIAYADRALATAPRDPDMVHAAGLVRLNAGEDLATARQLLRRASDSEPGNALFRADLARAGAG